MVRYEWIDVGAVLLTMSDPLFEGHLPGLHVPWDTFTIKVGPTATCTWRPRHANTTCPPQYAGADTWGRACIAEERTMFAMACVYPHCQQCP